MHMLVQKSGLVWEIDNVCLFLTYEVQSANSSPFISLCIVYSNIGHRAHKSSPCSAKTAPFVCTVLTDSILCPLTSSPQLSLSLPLICPALSPGNTLTDPCVRWALKTNYVFVFFKYKEYIISGKNNKKKIISIVCRILQILPHVRGGRYFPFPCAVFSLSYWYEK